MNREIEDEANRISETGSRLEIAVAEWLLDSLEDDYNPIKDLFNYGCASGIVSELIYYSDTVKFYQDHKEEINALLYETLESFGYSPSELFHDWDEQDPLCLNTHNQNLLAWFAFEETARRLFEEFI